MRIFWVLLPVIGLSACNNGKQEKEVPAGGPCSYKEDTFPAKLIQLSTSDSSSYNAQFEITRRMNTPDAPDTVLFHSLNNTYINAAQIISDSIAVGKIYKLIEQNIVSGSCNPHLQHIRLEKY